MAHKRAERILILILSVVILALTISRFTPEHKETEQMIVESVSYSNYSIERTRPSKLGIEQSITTVEGFTCPRCQYQNTELEHGSASGCPICGLHFRRYGNSLICSDEPIPEH